MLDTISTFPTGWFGTPNFYWWWDVRFFYTFYFYFLIMLWSGLPCSRSRPKLPLRPPWRDRLCKDACVSALERGPQYCQVSRKVVSINPGAYALQVIPYCRSSRASGREKFPSQWYTSMGVSNNSLHAVCTRPLTANFEAQYAPRRNAPALMNNMRKRIGTRGRCIVTLKHFPVLPAADEAAEWENLGWVLSTSVTNVDHDYFTYQTTALPLLDHIQCGVLQAQKYTEDVHVIQCVQLFRSSCRDTVSCDKLKMCSSKISLSVNGAALMMPAFATI